MKVDFQVPAQARQVGGLEKAIVRLGEALSEQGVDLAFNEVRPGSAVHFHGLWEPSFARLSRELRKQDRPYLVSPHGMLEPWAYAHKKWKKSIYFKLVEGRHLRGASAIIATGELEAGHLEDRLPGNRIERISFGAEPPPAGLEHKEARKNLGIQDDERLLLFLSRLDEKKGLNLLFDALRKLGRDKTSRWKVHVVGEGPMEEEWRRQAEQQAEELPEIVWRGALWDDSKWTEIVAADLFCLPTHSENFGFAVQEALSVGTPCLTTTATPWVEHAAEAGLHLCDPVVASVAEALDTWSRGTPWLEANRCRLASWTMETFDWDEVAKRYGEVYRRLSPRDEVFHPTGPVSE